MPSWVSGQTGDERVFTGLKAWGVHLLVSVVFTRFSERGYGSGTG